MEPSPPRTIPFREPEFWNSERYCVVIANWNGADIIDRCISSVYAAARRLPFPMDIHVVDDASTDDSAKVINERYPDIGVIRIRHNLGFGAAVNFAMDQFSNPFVFLLNNDLVLRSDFFEKMIETHETIDDPDIFAIGAQTLQWGETQSNHGPMRAQWRHQMIVQHPLDPDQRAAVDFVQAGAALLDREKFQALGGFSSVFAPGYWEDYDVSYRARKRGWKNYYEPEAAAWHWGKRSMTSRLGAAGVSLALKRNQLLFNWLNIHDDVLLRRHLMALALLIVRNPGGTRRDEASWARAYLGALRRLPRLLPIRRERRKQEIMVSDRSILFSDGLG